MCRTFIFLLLAMSLLALGCSGHEEQPKDSDASAWADELIEEYLNAHQEAIENSKTNPIAWIKQDYEENGKRMVTVKLGRSLETHFATERWIYIDSTNRTIYDYDLPNDSLIFWKRF